MPLLPEPLLKDLCAAAVNRGLDRGVLLSGIHPEIVAGLPNKPNVLAQLRSDLAELNRIERARDGTVPLRSWLENAQSLTAYFVEGEVFERALEKLTEVAQTPPPPPRKGHDSQKLTGKFEFSWTFKLLFLTANPTESTRLELDEELRAVGKNLQSAPHGDKIRLEHAGAVRATDLAELLMRFAPAIVHFSGHGSTIGELWFQDDAGGIAPVQPRLLGRIFGALDDSPVFGVVLNACYAAAQAAEILPHVEFVIGMSTAIKDGAARSFSATFYQALAFGKSVQAAFDLARVQIDLAGLDQADVPQLLVREGQDAKKLYLIARS
ncbi:MAG: CHAT domain-containing protein [Polyangiaceae bacterium]